MSEEQSQPRSRGSNKFGAWLNIFTSFGVILSAIAAAFSGYAAFLANASSEKIAGLQAISQWNSLINAYPQAGACTISILSSQNNLALSEMINKQSFTIEIPQNTIANTERCLGKSGIKPNSKIEIRKTQSAQIMSQIFNEVNGYESMLLYKDNLGNSATGKIICAEVYPSFQQDVRPLIMHLEKISDNSTAKTLLSGYPAILHFMKVKDCDE